jgi:hypothetical protein
VLSLSRCHSRCHTSHSSRAQPQPQAPRLRIPATLSVRFESKLSFPRGTLSDIPINLYLHPLAPLLKGERRVTEESSIIISLQLFVFLFLLFVNMATTDPFPKVLLIGDSIVEYTCASL